MINKLISFIYLFRTEVSIKYFIRISFIIIKYVISFLIFVINFDFNKIRLRNIYRVSKIVWFLIYVWKYWLCVHFIISLIFLVYNRIQSKGRIHIGLWFVINIVTFFILSWRIVIWTSSTLIHIITCCVVLRHSLLC